MQPKLLENSIFFWALTHGHDSFCEGNSDLFWTSKNYLVITLSKVIQKYVNGIWLLTQHFYWASYSYQKLLKIVQNFAFNHYLTSRSKYFCLIFNIFHLLWQNNLSVLITIWMLILKFYLRTSSTATGVLLTSTLRNGLSTGKRFSGSYPKLKSNKSECCWRMCSRDGSLTIEKTIVLVKESS